MFLQQVLRLVVNLNTGMGNKNRPSTLGVKTEGTDAGANETIISMVFQNQAHT